ncbi:hypothetical protein [Chryseobacterium sp. T1]
MKKILFFLLLSCFAFGQNSVKDTILANSKAFIFKLQNHKIYLGNPSNLKFEKNADGFKAFGNDIDFNVYYSNLSEPTKQVKDAMLVVNKCKANEITCSIGFDEVDNYTYFNNTFVTKDLELNDSYVIYLKNGGSIGVSFKTKVPKDYADKKAELVDSFKSLILEGLIIREDYYKTHKL